MRNNLMEKGITVITLVITIIVMLILAGTAIGVISNNGGLFEKAKSAVEEYNKKQKEEEESLNELLKKIDGWSSEDGVYTPLKIGDVVIIDGEEFYVLEDSDVSKSTVTLFAKYNLNKAGTKQAPNAKALETSCEFSSTKYWDSVYQDIAEQLVGSGSYSILDINNVSGENTGDAIYKAKQYATLKGGINGRLLTYEEANSLKDTYSDMIWGSPSQLSYWLSSTKVLFSGNKANNVLGIDYFAYLNYYDEDEFPSMPYDSEGGNGSGSSSFGVRPVITVPKAVCSFNVQYYANGGSGTISDEQSKKIVASGEGLTPPSPDRTFGGWNTKSDGTGTDYSVGQKITSSLDLYAKWYYTTESNLSIGQEVSVGRERFYVLENSNSTQSTVTLLSKYNLHKNGTAQAPNSDLKDTSCLFSSTNYWKDTWDAHKDEWDLGCYGPINVLDLNKVSGEAPGDAIYKAKQYAVSKGGTNGRLLTINEYSDLEDGYKNMLFGEANHWYYKSDSNANYSEGYGLAYWLSSASDYKNTAVFAVNGINDYDSYDSNDYNSISYGCGYNAYGVRPVITVPKNLTY